MAWSAHTDEDQMREHRVDEKTLETQGKQLADLIRKSRHFIVFTGAGLSTSAGIPDFRFVALKPTGPEGVWTLRAQGKSVKHGVSSHKAFPTLGHMALVGLAQADRLKFLISQNCDGIHRRSGFPPEKLAELHGNSNLEKCRQCGREYLRDYICDGRSVHDHRTGRKCVCGGELEDSIINFGENLPEKPLRDGFRAAEKADLCLVLGSSLTVTPAADMPRKVGERGQMLVICNLQKTPLDHLSKLRIFGKTDELMGVVMRELGVGVPGWSVRRHLLLSLLPSVSPLLSLTPLDTHNTPASFLSAVQLSLNGSGRKSILKSEPFQLRLAPQNSFKIGFEIILHFMGHFNEPPLKLNVVFDMNTESEIQKRYELNFDPSIGQWAVNSL